MKKNKTIIWLLLAVVMFVLAGCGNNSGTTTSRHSESVNNNSGNTRNGTESNDDKKTLIVYYSYSGTTERVAEHLQKLTNPVASYLEQADFGGKTVAPFWTYITNQGSTSKNFAKRCQNVEMADGLAIRSANGMSDEELDRTLSDWLQQYICIKKSKQ